MTNEVTEESFVEEVKLENKPKTTKSEENSKVDDFDWSTFVDLESSVELNKDEESMYSSSMPVIEESKYLMEKL